MANKDLKAIIRFFKDVKHSPRIVFVYGAIALLIAIPMSMHEKNSEDYTFTPLSVEDEATDEIIEKHKEFIKENFEGNDFDDSHDHFDHKGPEHHDDFDSNKYPHDFKDHKYSHDDYKDENHDDYKDFKDHEPFDGEHKSFMDHDKSFDHSEDFMHKKDYKPHVKPYHGSADEDGHPDMDEMLKHHNDHKGPLPIHGNPDHHKAFEDHKSSDESHNSDEHSDHDDDKHEPEHHFNEDEWERNKERMKRDFRWQEREVKELGLDAELAEYESLLSKIDLCEEGDWNCIEDIRWALQDWQFAVQDKIKEIREAEESQRCEQDAHRMEREMKHHQMQLDREISDARKMFGPDAAKEFIAMIKEMKAIQNEMIELQKQCEFGEADDLRFEKLHPLEDKMRRFWEENGNKFHEDFEGEQCDEIRHELQKMKEEVIPQMDVELRAEAEAFIAEAGEHVRTCDMEALEGLKGKARRLGLLDHHEIGYREIHRDQIKGFDGHEEHLEHVFDDLGARDDNRVYERMAQADRSHLDRILEDDDEEFRKKKLKFLRHAQDQDTANDFLKQSAEIKALLDEVAALKAEVRSLRDEISSYNFYGAGSETVKEALEDESISEDKRREIIEKAKRESREAKFKAKLIPFEDTDDDSYFVDAVKRLKEKGIVKGKSDGAYDPGSAATIAEAVKIILETTEHSYAEGDTGVKSLDEHWARGYFKKLQELAVALPDTNVNRPITRGELAMIILKVKELPYENLDKPVFTDMPSNHRYYKPIQTLNAKGVFNGSNGNARPDDTLNRAEIATFMNNVLEKL